MSHWIRSWDPEDAEFWARTGKRVARRNLWWSIVAENLGFSVWLLWSAVAARLPQAGFRYTTAQLFALVSLPGLVGALMRFPYTFAVPRFGGRNWTVVSALVLLVPTLSLALLVERPATPYWLMMLASATAGLGGGNFASSMANISFFFPDREKGLALGLNAAGGNLGVATVQLVVPLVVGGAVVGSGAGAHGGGLHLARAGWMWLPLIAAAAIGAARFMDNLATARSSLRAQLSVARDKHTWIIALLYIGTFGSFVGYSAAFPLLVKTQFPSLTANVAFVGPLVGALARPLGGLVADRRGGARVTAWSFAAMALAAGGVLASLRAHALGGFAGSFVALFVASGLGNGSTFRMIPAIFGARARGDEARARRDGAAAIGIASAVGALGGFVIPRALGASIQATGGAATAFALFVAGYGACLALTWACYLRAAAAGVCKPEGDARGAHSQRALS